MRVQLPTAASWHTLALFLALPLLLAVCAPVTLFGLGAPPAAITSSPTPSQLARASVYLLDDEFAVNRGFSLVSLNAATGAERWWLTTPLTFPALLRAGPGVTGDTAYVGADDGALYAVDATSGAQHWRFDATGWRSSGILLDSFKSVESPVVINGVIFFASPAWTGSTKGVCGAAYAVDTGTGTERWRYNNKGSFDNAFGVQLVVGQ
jgi:outer membrane protein assembly factor BamB